MGGRGRCSRTAGGRGGHLQGLTAARPAAGPVTNASIMLAPVSMLSSDFRPGLPLPHFNKHLLGAEHGDEPHRGGFTLRLGLHLQVGAAPDADTPAPGLGRTSPTQCLPCAALRSVGIGVVADGMADPSQVSGTGAQESQEVGSRRALRTRARAGAGLELRALCVQLPSAGGAHTASTQPGGLQGLPLCPPGPGAPACL